MLVIEPPSIFNYSGINMFDIPGINKALGIDPNPIKEQIEMYFKYEKILKKMYKSQKKYIKIKNIIIYNGNSNYKS